MFAVIAGLPNALFAFWLSVSIMLLILVLRPYTKR